MAPGKGRGFRRNFRLQATLRDRLRAPNAEETAYYHCISRLVNREFVLGDEEREEFVKLLRGYERFRGVQIMTFCVMSNHFRILLGVPPRPADCSHGEVAPPPRAKPICKPISASSIGAEAPGGQPSQTTPLAP